MRRVKSLSLVCVSLSVFSLFLVRQRLPTGTSDTDGLSQRLQYLLRKNSSVSAVTSSTNSNTAGYLCPLTPPNLIGSIAARMEVLSVEELERRHPELKPGGRFKPNGCLSRHRVAIIVPYRDRGSHLKIFLNNLHPLLQRQQLDYGIYVVEQALPSMFNRATLLNIGYKEALKDYNFQCCIFHDVDLIPENDKNLYTCPVKPRHMSVAIDIHNYKLYYRGAFGGVTALTTEHMNKVNGFSNKYFGWGMEDDDMLRRVRLNRLTYTRPSEEIARYKMIRHGRDKLNPKSKNRKSLFKRLGKDSKIDGLNSLRYRLLKRENRKLYTWVYVDIDDGS